MTNGNSAYARAGVNIDSKMRALRNAKALIRKTMTSSVEGDWGSFGGMFRSPGKDWVLVSSIDGVGTKLKVAKWAGRHDTVGQDIVNHDDVVAGVQFSFKSRLTAMPFGLFADKKTFDFPASSV